MGLIRGGLLIIASVLLFLLFLIGNLFYIFSLSLDYKNVQEELLPIIKDIVQKDNVISQLENEFGIMGLYCQNNSEYVFSHEDYVIAVPCEVISKDLNNVVDYGVNNLVEQAYYKDYDCSFWNCLKESPVFLVSEKSKNYWASRFYIVLALSIILIILMFFLIEQKTNFPILVGILLIAPALLLKLTSPIFFKLILPLLSSFAEFKIQIDILNIFLTKSNYVFIVSFVIGGFILAVGIILKFFKFGFKISEFFSKFKKEDNITKKEVKEIIKEEVSKAVPLKKIKKK